MTVIRTLGVLGLCALPLAAPAQSISSMLAQSGLSPEDFHTMGQAARTLYADTTPVAGASTTWTNPDSGSHGGVTLTGVEGNCVDIQHSVHPQGAEEAREIRNRRCQSDTGDWLNAAE
ncbi:MAG: hypothetical protein OIF47_13985 [Marinibacterium sp.]|nr:hypothetical protein [Marinibacterium sp.]